MRNSWLWIVAGLTIGLAAAEIQTAHAGQALADANGSSVTTTSQGLRATAIYPGAQAMKLDNRVVSIFGVPMTGGQSPKTAADAFWAAHSLDFGIASADLDLRPTRTNTLSNGSTVIAYEQYLAGHPVDMGIARIVTHPDGNRVTLASGRLSQLPTGGFAKPAMSAEHALASVKAINIYKKLQTWSKPTLVIHDAGIAAGGGSTPRLAWKFTGDTDSPPARFTFFVDAAAGTLLEARDGILFVDISGKVQAKSTPGNLPDRPSNPPVIQPVDLIRVIGGTTVETDILGNYLLPNGGSSAINVSTSLSNGKWCRVMDFLGNPVLSLSQSVLPPGPGDFLFNDVPTEHNTAQTNAFILTTKIHNYFLDRNPTFTQLNTQMPTIVNRNDWQCNAFYDFTSINFVINAAGCVNSAYGNIVSHEYGHHVVAVLGLAQNAFGEGYGDTCGVLLQDTGIIAQDFCGPGCHIRNIDSANKQYPCAGGGHDCGQVLAGVWRDLRLKMGDNYGSAPGLEMTMQMQVDWSLITVGEQNGSNGAWPQTAIEVMTVNDDDGTLLNGCPNYDELVYAFGKHNIDLPELHAIVFVYPDGLPTSASANVSVPITVDIVDGYEHQIPSTAKLLYRFRPSDPFAFVGLNKEADGKYHGDIPGVVCGHTAEYKISINTSEVPGAHIDPPTGAFSYQVVGSAVLVDDFEGASTFTVTGAAFIPGKWNLVDPNGTVDGSSGAQVQSEDDTTPGTGVKCWVTGNAAPGAAPGAGDIDGSETILNSPAFDLSGIVDPVISYQRWFYNSGPTDTGNYLIIELSNNGGSSWSLVEQVGPGGPNTQGGWVLHQFSPNSILAPTNNMKIRFRASDKTPDHIVEAAIDDFTVISNTCDCPADFDGTGFVDTDDFDAFVHAFELGGDDADFDNSGFVDTDDYDAFVLAFTIGC
ncbi:MAG: hypothetical protein IT435_20750 [Phycisphaerales bacterium]|nr:hypothetical protein [Phycisphaerales bacterium]